MDRHVNSGLADRCALSAHFSTASDVATSDCPPFPAIQRLYGNPTEHGRIHTDSKSHDVFAIIAAITPRVVVMLPKGQKCYVPLYLNAGDILIFDSTVCHYGGITPNDSLVDGVSLGIHCYGGPVTEEILEHTFTC